jgi:hypothetical protein
VENHLEAVSKITAAANDLSATANRLSFPQMICRRCFLFLRRFLIINGYPNLIRLANRKISVVCDKKS